MELLTRREKYALKRLGVSKADLHRGCRTCWGDVWGLYNDYYLTDMVFCGCSDTNYIYRTLARKLLKQVGFIEEV